VITDPSRPASFLSNTPARPWDRRLGGAIVLLSLLAFAVTVPFAGLPWLQEPAFVPAYGSALVLTYLITALLLISQFRQLRSPSVLIIGAGYLFNGCVTTAHVLSFPQVFGPGSLIGGTDQTAPWLYVFWHAVFPVFVIAYALVAHTTADRPLAAARVGPAIWSGVALVVLVAGGFILFAILDADHLPTVIIGDDYARTWHILGRGRALWFLSTLAPVLLWYRTRARTVLDLWLLVVSITWLLDFMLSAVITTVRYDLGWYAGRLYGLLAASFVLGALLMETGNLYGRLIRSIETLRARADALAQSQERLRHAQKMEAMGQLTGGIAHDFNNLLTVIVGNLDMMARHAEDPARVRRLAAAAQRAAARGGTLTHQLLMFARRQLLRPQIVDPNRLLRDFEGLIRRAVGEAIMLELALHPTLDRIHVDPIQFEAAILNLVINARDAMAGGGRLIVQTRNAALDAAAAATHDAQPGAYAVIAVKDTGAGIPAALLGKVFEPFFTTKDVGKGSGLGLSQVYGFVKESGGHVRIDSTEGVGTTVALWLPRTVETAQAVAARRPRAALVGD
jgi:signal transduction histidine kinase